MQKYIYLKTDKRGTVIDSVVIDNQINNEEALGKSLYYHQEIDEEILPEKEKLDELLGIKDENGYYNNRIDENGFYTQMTDHEKRIANGYYSEEEQMARLLLDQEYRLCVMSIEGGFEYDL